MTRKAIGLFLWVKHVTDKPCRGHRRFEDFERLKRRLGELLKGLVPMYPSILDDLGPKDLKKTMNLLVLLLVAKRPLNDHELRFTIKGFPRIRVCCNASFVGELCYSLFKESLMPSD